MEIELMDNLDYPVLTQIYRLRAEVWHKTLPIKSLLFSDGLWTDEHDNHAIHWAVVSNNQVLAAARLCIHKTLEKIPNANVYMDSEKLILPPIASMNRLVIHPIAQRNGLSKQFDAIRINQARKDKCRSVVVCLSESTKRYRINSLLKQGFQQAAKERIISDGSYRYFGVIFPYVLDLT